MLFGLAGADTIDGGAGIDSVLYYREIGSRGIQADLQAGTVLDTYGTRDVLMGIERLWGSNANDTIFGHSFNGDMLFGHGGNDVIDGRGGNDTLVGGQGADTIRGGTGDDQVAYFLEQGARGVTVDLAAGTATDTFGTADRLSGIDRVYGTDRVDALRGSAVEDRLFGRAGNDLIDGRGGNDTLVGGQGADTIRGGDGKDQVAYFLEAGTKGVRVDLRAGTATDTFGTADRLEGIEYAFGSEQGDLLLGTDQDGDRLFGRGGNDTIDARDGDNLIYTGSGNDVVRVGTTTFDARDTVVIDGNGRKTIIGSGSEGTRYGHHIVFEVDAALTVNLGAGIATTGNGLHVDFTQALHFLEVGGTAYADRITGGNTIHDDLEWYVGHQGNDTIDGGTGTGDTVVYDDEVLYGQFNYDLGRQEYGTHGAVINLATGVATDTFGFTDTLINIDQIRGTKYADTVVGSDEDNGFWMLGGNDVIDGGEGFDRVHYDDDTMHGGTGAVFVDLAAGRAIDGYGGRDTLKNIEAAFTSAKNDTIIGSEADNRLFAFKGDDTVKGGGGSDVILGHEGRDTLRGEAGDDEIWGGEGDDIVDGGHGTDVARYLDDARGIAADLTAGRVTDGSGGQDTLISIENLHGSAHGDRIVGNAGANQLFGMDGRDTIFGNAGDDVVLGGGGNDQLSGGSGNDELRGGGGSDTLDGGTGTDVARYLDARSGAVVDLAAGRAQDGDGGTDRLIGIEDVHGSEHGDTLRGDAGANQLFGMGGRDRIEGGEGADTLLGGDGNDLLLGGTGNDALRGGAGGDTLDGGAGRDVARYLDAERGINVNLATGRAADGLGGQDTLIGIEGLHGSAFADTVLGDALGNELSGFGGNDVLSGGGGHDTLLGGEGADRLVGGIGEDELWGGAGADTIDGSEGSDLVRYLTEGRGIVADLGQGTVRDGSGSIDRLISIERLHGSDHDDAITGDATGNRLFGFGGRDTIRGGDGADTILGGAGDDRLEGGTGSDELWGGAGDDTIDGGAGDDLLRYRDAATAVSVDLGQGTARDGMGSIDRLISIEDVHGSEHGDALTGDAAANELFGMGGNDVVSGGGGADILLGGDGRDTLRGGDGNDQLWGEAGTDLIDGGTGADMARYRGATSGVDADLAAGRADDGYGYVDTLRGIEHLHGSDHADILRGSDAANELFGFDGDDTIEGGAGADTLSGAAGNDDYLFGGGFGYDVVNDLGGGWDEVTIHGYRSENATIQMQGDHVVLSFGYGDTVVLANSARAGQASTIERVTFGDGESWSHAELMAHVGQTPSPYARVTASADANSLFGDGGADAIDGMGGDDLILGAGGNDRLLGGAGADTIRGGDGDDRIEGGAGNDLLAGGAGADAFVLRTGMGRDRIEDFELGVDWLDLASGGPATQSVDGNGNRVVTLSDGSSVTLVGVGGRGDAARAVSVSGATTEDATLYADMSGMTGLFGDRAGTPTFQWMRGDRAIAGATAATYDLVQQDVGQRIWVKATVDGRVLSSTPTRAIANLNDAPEGDVTISGRLREGETLTADTAALTDEDGMGALAYQWLRGGVEIEGATGRTHDLSQQDVGAMLEVRVTYADGHGTLETAGSVRSGPVVNVNDLPTGSVRLFGTAVEGSELRGDASLIEDEDGLGTFQFQWMRDGSAIAGATGSSYTLTGADVQAEVSLRVRYVDGQGTTETLLSDATPPVKQGTLTLVGTDGADNLVGADGNDVLSGRGGNDRILGNAGNDTIGGGDGADTLNGGDGNDVITGGDSEADLRDIVYGGNGDDKVDGGYGNDQLNGGLGNDSMEGGFGVDEVFGNEGDDVLTGSAYSDLIFGGDGNDFVNGGFGSDRVNGGDGADKFYHLGIFDHGNDWIQDYDASEGDVLLYGGRVTRDQFQVNLTRTANAGADDVEEAFVIFRPTGQILWALVDGGGQDQIMLQLGSETFDLLG